jgi:hypothetical protein
VTGWTQHEADAWIGLLETHKRLTREAVTLARRFAPRAAEACAAVADDEPSS